MLCGPWPARRVFRVVWWMICTLSLCTLPLIVWEFRRHSYDTHYLAWFVAGMFVIMTVPISVYEVAMHTEYYTRPKLQRHVIRIIWMVPIYSVDAWLALRFKDARIYLNPVRECYEAYVIYNFYAYLMSFLEDELGNVEEYVAKKAPIKQMWPFSYCVRPWRMGHQFLWETKKGVLNYVILRPLCTLGAIVTDHYDKYGSGSINPTKSYAYLAFVTNCSQMWALYCLIMFYQALHKELSPIRPLSKFITIKLVVFLTFWQGLSISILASLGVIKADEQFTTYSASDVAEGLQDFLICVEMLFAALAHAFAFPPRDYMDANIPTKGFFTNVRYMFDLRDVVDDVQGVIEDHAVRATEHGKKAVKATVKGVAATPGQLFTLITQGRVGGSPRRAGAGSDEADPRRASLLALADQPPHHSSDQPASGQQSPSYRPPGGRVTGEVEAAEPPDRETAPFLPRTQMAE